MQIKNAVKLAAILLAIGAPLVFSPPVLAQAAEVSQVENFIKTVVQAMATIAGFIAVAFIVIGGYTYITSSGNPEKLEKAKHTLLYSGIGLVVVIAAFVITNFISNAAKGAFGG